MRTSQKFDTQDAAVIFLLLSILLGFLTILTSIFLPVIAGTVGFATIIALIGLTTTGLITAFDNF